MLRSEKFHCYLSGYILRAKTRILHPNKVMSTGTGRLMILKVVCLRVQVFGKVKLCPWVNGDRGAFTFRLTLHYQGIMIRRKIRNNSSKDRASHPERLEN
jgi:hypothetical protein